MTSTVQSEVGDWRWLEQTGGKLELGQRIMLAPEIARSVGRYARDRFRLALGWRRASGLAGEDLWSDAPDSTLARQAVEAAQDLQSTALVHHGYRTWMLGSALATIDEVALDGELFFASAMLHDSGLESPVAGQCFTYRSAQAVAQVARKVSLDQASTTQMMDAIARHITPGLTHDVDPMAFYLQVGAQADLVGGRLWELPDVLITRVNQEFPRENVLREVSARWKAEANAVPEGRAHYAQRWGRFADAVRLAPYPE